ncbi:SAM-dependent methyltransferase [Arthrobacter mobilis]|uniref:Class I SAM-dependent methyltransferase n=1 Tax=Arthrobacter mobilis TaxID=2724944 RepID=A0A7X6HER3_9MICC|nr:class I SAM-dependent methyltransferase [Arthrobacter mobilis]NKX54828.1 class I SAM-dependent methyltransferase [Arthrobacter mobilis]
MDKTADQFWDSFYRERGQVWSGKPNPVLVREAAGLAPGLALDLGCGEGADAIWLAQQGWRVTAVDISAVALRRAAGHGTDAGVADRIDWQQQDLAAWTPDGSYDLVSAQFLHSPVELPREKILHTAAAAVAPGGTLLVVGHESFPPWSRHPEPDVPLPTAAELVRSLGLDDGNWRLEVVDSSSREVTGPDGQQAVLADSVLRARRLGG